MAEITQAGIDALKEQLDEVEGYLRLDEQRQVVAQLEATSTAPGFWDDAEAASGVMAELTQAKDEVSRVDAARQRLGDIQAAFDLGQETGEEELLDEADGLAAALGRELSELELASWFSDELDHGDAIVELPHGAREWARSDKYTQIFSYGTALGVQFHPEVTRESATVWAENNERVNTEDIVAGYDAHEGELASTCKTLADWVCGVF